MPVCCTTAREFVVRNFEGVVCFSWGHVTAAPGSEALLAVCEAVLLGHHETKDTEPQEFVLPCANALLANISSVQPLSFVSSSIQKLHAFSFRKGGNGWVYDGVRVQVYI